METIKIPFKGINRNIDDGIADDGQCMELINARIRNGSIEPMGRPQIVTPICTTVQEIFYHTTASRALAIVGAARTVEAYSYDMKTFLQQLSGEIKGVKRIECIGNVAVFFLEGTTRYCIFRNGTYQYLGEKPEVPAISYVPVGKVFNVSPETKLLVGRDSDGYSNDEFYASLDYAVAGMYDNCIDSANKTGHFFGKLFVVAALRMYDGSYIAYSPVSLVEAANDLDHAFKCGSSDTQRTTTMGRYSPIASCYKDPNSTTKRYERCEAAVYATSMGIILPPLTQLAKWKDVIVSIDIFVAPFSFCVKEKTKYRTGLEYEDYRSYFGSLNKQKEIIADASIFYKYAEYDIDGNLSWMLEDVSTDSLALQQRLPFTDLIYPVAADVTYTYNNRLHIARYRQYFQSRFTLNLIDNIYPMGGGTTADVTLYYYIKTDSADSIVKIKANCPRTTIAPYLMYYDSRAYKVLVTYKDVAGSLFGKEFTLTKHKTLNMAYYVEWEEGESRLTYNVALAIDLAQFPTIESEPAEQHTFEEKTNILKVSALSNPFVFPAAQTYQPSSADIVGCCSNTQAISQGQFGQHPLYVFTQDGIYAMSVDTSGSTVYATQTPVSRDVCSNPLSITGTDRAVLFATDRGLMSISGAQTQLLSEEINGCLPSCIDSSPLFAKIAGVAQLSQALSTTEFYNYLKEAHVGYNYADAEVVIGRPDYPYSYVLNVNSGAWAKASYTVHSFTNKYPECYAILIKEGTIGSKNLCNLHNPHRTVNKMLLLTKPIRMGTNSHKRIMQSALRGILRRARSDIYFRGEPVMFRDEAVDVFSDVGLYILGSNDAEHFQLISGKESINDLRDLVTKMNKSAPYKYFAVALAGGVRTDVAINYMEFLADTSFTNRLR